MPFDLSALFDSITHGVAKIPSAVMAAIILGGPTAIWIITRFVHPPEVAKSVEVATEDRLWLCASCLSINEDRHLQCYRCSRPRAAESQPVVIHGATAASPRIGVAVGPGVGESHPMPTGWLGGEFVATGLPTETPRRAAPSKAPSPVRSQSPALTRESSIDPEPRVTQSEEPVHVEPQILEPRVKVSTRASAKKPAAKPAKKPAAKPAKPAAPRGRQTQGAGEAN